MQASTSVAVVLLSVLVWIGTTDAHAGEPQTPLRVVSMNLCTDQLAMLIAASAQLHSVSHLATEPEASVLAQDAKAFQVNHGQAEEIFLMKPDLILAGTYTTRTTVNLLKRLGFRVEEFAPETSMADIRSNIRRMGMLLNRREKAEAVIEEFDRQLSRLQAQPSIRKPLAVPYYANAYTSGRGTLVDAVITEAGLGNLASALGIEGPGRLPLEMLIVNRPDIVILDETSETAPALAQGLFQHPAFRHVSRTAEIARVPDKYWSCGGPFVIEALKVLIDARNRVNAREEKLRSAEQGTGHR